MIARMLRPGVIVAALSVPILAIPVAFVAGVDGLGVSAGGPIFWDGLVLVGVVYFPLTVTPMLVAVACGGLSIATTLLIGRLEWFWLRVLIFTASATAWVAVGSAVGFWWATILLGPYPEGTRIGFGPVFAVFWVAALLMAIPALVVGSLSLGPFRRRRLPSAEVQ